MLIGIDEVGRGSWAGPLLVVAATQTGAVPKGLTDSKLLSRSQRNAVFSHLTSGFQFGEGWVEPSEIDALGLSGAMRLGVQRALAAIDATPTDEIIIDGHINYCKTSYKNVRCVVKADMSEPIVSAASIYAKVTRDNYMTAVAKQFPEYGFEKHVGYGTALHRQALQTLGSCELHRKSYKPIHAFL